MNGACLFWSQTNDLARSRYGVVRRSFFVPDTRCQAHSSGVPGVQSMRFSGKRPQNALRGAAVPGTVSFWCLALARTWRRLR